MLLKRSVLLFIQIYFSIPIVINSEDYKTAECTKEIILENFKRKTQIVFMNGDNDKILPAVYQMHHVTLLLLTSTAQRLSVPFHTDYLVVANSCYDFIKKLTRITHGVLWNANAKLIVISKNIDDPKCIFDILLKKHMVNVVLLNDTATLELYTYNPYEDFGCGKKYNRIIKLGRCKGNNVFYEKIVNGLRNCTFQVFSAHLPPFVIDPATNESQHRGIEQYVLKVLEKKEGFKSNITYGISSDEFTIIAANMSAIGPLSSLQNGEADIITGGMLLTYDRATVFEFLTGGMIFSDYLGVHVAKAKQISNLKNTYAGFQSLTWLALLIVFVVYSALMTLIMRKQSNHAIVLKMLGHFLQQSSRIKGDKPNRVFIFWIFFAYLINCYYQSSLISFIFHPRLDYQISNFEDVKKYDLKPCISLSMLRVSQSVNLVTINNNSLGCDGRSDSLKKVAESSNYFTVYLDSLFAFEESQYYNAYGKPKLHSLNSPKTQVLHAIYFYKGFPFRERLQHHCHYIDASGLINRYYDRLQFSTKVKLKVMSQAERNFFIPWFVLIFGTVLSSLVFCLEVVINKKLYKCILK